MFDTSNAEKMDAFERLTELLSKKGYTEGNISEGILMPDSLIDVLRADPECIVCFSEKALETEIGANGKKVWQYVFDTNYAVADKIPLNDERVEYFLSLYSKNSCEYEYFFKKHYKQYLRSKREKPVSNRSKDASVVEDVIMAVLFGCSAEKAIDAGTAASRAKTDRNASLPIYSRVWVPDAFAKELDKEEYLEAIYAQLGIQILGEASGYYYDVVLPEGVRISEDSYGYCLKDAGGNTLLHYFDRGPFYDRDVFVDAINVGLRMAV